MVGHGIDTCGPCGLWTLWVPPTRCLWVPPTRWAGVMGPTHPMGWWLGLLQPPWSFAFGAVWATDHPSLPRK